MKQPDRNFIKRFTYLEIKANQSKKSGKHLHDMSLAEMNIFWNEAKKFKIYRYIVTFNYITP